MLKHKHRTIPGPDYEATLAAAIDHHAAGRIEEAKRLLRGMTVLDADDPRPFKLLGSILLRESARGDAAVCYRRALELDCRDLYTLAALAEIALDAARLDDAKELLARVFALDPEGLHPAANRCRQLLEQAIARLTAEQARQR